MLEKSNLPVTDSVLYLPLSTSAGLSIIAKIDSEAAIPFWISLLTSVNWRIGLISTPEAIMKATKLPVDMVSKMNGLSINPVTPAKAKETIKMINGLLKALVNAIFMFCLLLP